MAPAVPYIIAGVAAAGTAYQSAQTSKKQIEAGRLAAEAELASTQEEQRKLQKKNEYIESLAKARAGASGVGMGGTVANYLADLHSSGLADLDWLGKVGASRATASIMTGQISSSQSKAGMWSSLGKVGSSGYSAYAAA